MGEYFYKLDLSPILLNFDKKNQENQQYFPLCTDHYQFGSDILEQFL